MRYQRIAKRRFQVVRKTVLLRGALHDWRNIAVMHMANMRKQVVFDLEIQTAQAPVQKPVVAREVGGGQ